MRDLSPKAAPSQEETLATPGNQMSGCFEAPGRLMGASTQKLTCALTANPVEDGQKWKSTGRVS